MRKRETGSIRISSWLTVLVLALCGVTPACAGTPAAPPVPEGSAEAIFAGGCFWCLEAAFDGLPGVLSAHSGYTGGRLKNPTYRQVSDEDTGHVEAVRVLFDPKRTSYEQLLETFWHNIDPTDDAGQFCDRGPSYRAAIFVTGMEQKRLAESSRDELVASGVLRGRVVTPIHDATTFYIAEDYHQDYHVKNPADYQSYRRGCGRDRRLREIWQPRR